jgi:FAD/FMN-containing dehydrogenase
MPGVKRFELVVLAALVVSLPSLAQAFSGGISLTSALVRVGLALLVCGAVGALVERTIDTYARDARQREIERRVAQAIEARKSFWRDREGSSPPAGAA